MTDTWKCFVLPEAFRPAEDDSLRAFLQANPAAAVRVDASRLRRLDGTVVELLLVAARAWRQKGLGFEVTGLSRPNEEICIGLGLRTDMLMWRVAA